MQGEGRKEREGSRAGKRDRENDFIKGKLV